MAYKHEEINHEQKHKSRSFSPNIEVVLRLYKEEDSGHRKHTGNTFMKGRWDPMLSYQEKQNVQ